MKLWHLTQIMPFECVEELTYNDRRKGYSGIFDNSHYVINAV